MQLGYLRFKLRQHRLSATAVTLGTIFFALVMLLAYSEFDLEGMIQGAQGGQDILKVMAGAQGVLTWGVSAFLGMIWRHPLVLVLSIGYALALGGDFAAGEIGDKTADLVFSRPTTRQRLLNSHLIVGSGLLLVVTSVFSVFVFAVSNILGLEPPGLLRFVAALWQYFVFMWTVLMIAYLIGAMTAQSKAVTAIGGGLFSIMYAVELVAGLWSVAEPLRGWSLFSYLAPAGALTADATAIGNTITLMAVGIICLGLAQYLMWRRDL